MDDVIICPDCGAEEIATTVCEDCGVSGCYSCLHTVQQGGATIGVVCEACLAKWTATITERVNDEIGSYIEDIRSAIYCDPDASFVSPREIVSFALRNQPDVYGADDKDRFAKRIEAEIKACRDSMSMVDTESD